jgi:hypothetical protein
MSLIEHEVPSWKKSVKKGIKLNNKRPKVLALS